MATEAAERRAVVRAQQLGAPLPPVEQQDPLPCPRCTSTNTKFCYYNNYNFSQPRHFCKSCRRYWTHGGTLRDIPVGGGSRKTAKRSRTSSATSAVSSPTSSCSGGVSMGPLLEPIPVNQHAPAAYTGGGGGVGGGFTSLLSGAGGHAGLLALGGFGLGLGLDEMGFGLGRGVWAFQNNNNNHHHQQQEVGLYGGVHHNHHESNGNGSNCNSGSPNDHRHHEGGVIGIGLGAGNAGEEGNVSRNDTWQVESGEVVGFVNGDCFTSLPELAMSTTTTTSGTGLK